MTFFLRTRGERLTSSITSEDFTLGSLVQRVALFHFTILTTAPTTTRVAS